MRQPDGSGDLRRDRHEVIRFLFRVDVHEYLERGEGEGRGGVDDRNASPVPPGAVGFCPLTVEGGLGRLGEPPDADQL